MTIDTMSAAVSLLTSEGFQATVEYPGTIQIIFERSDGSGRNQTQLAVFGTANPKFGADIYHDFVLQDGIDDSVETDIASDCNDPVLVAETIANTIDPDAHHRFQCALCRCLLTSGDKVVFHQNSDTSIDVFCSDACKNQTQN